MIYPYLGEIDSDDGDKLWVFWPPDGATDLQWDAAIYKHISMRNCDLVIPRKTPPPAVARLFDRRLIFSAPSIGGPVNLGCLEDCTQIAQFLASFHRDVHGFVPEPQRNRGDDLLVRWKRRKRRLTEFVRIAEHRSSPGLIDKFLSRIQNELMEQVDNGLRSLSKSLYPNLIMDKGCVCFYHYSKELFWRKGAKVAPWTFTGCVWDIPVVDLYRFLYHLTSYSGYSVVWIEKSIEAYERTRPLSNEEKPVLKSLFLFPERVYRIFSTYYLTRRECSHRRLLQRLINEWGRSDERLMQRFL